MHIDWTINISDLLTIVGFVLAAGAIFLKMHDRLKEVELWIKLEGPRADKALAVLEIVGKALEKVTALYEKVDDKVDGLEDRLNTHHEDLDIHRPARV